MRNVRLLLAQSFTAWNDNNAPRLGAALAFYTILSMSPLVIFVINIVSLLFNRSSAQGLLLAQVHSLLGAGGRDAVEAVLRSGNRHNNGFFLTLMGFATSIFGASAVFTELRSALNAIWRATPARGSGLWCAVREHLFSFGMVLGVGFILLASLLASAVLEAMARFFSSRLPFPASFLSLMDSAISFIGVTILFALILKYVPETKIRWRDVRLGAILTSLLFTFGKSLLAFYLGRVTPGSAYGAAGSLVAMVIWVYYSAQIFYFGAEVTHAYASMRHAGARGKIQTDAYPS